MVHTFWLLSSIISQGIIILLLGCCHWIWADKGRIDVVFVHQLCQKVLIIRNAFLFVLLCTFLIHLAKQFLLWAHHTRLFLTRIYIRNACTPSLNRGPSSRVVDWLCLLGLGRSIFIAHHVLEIGGHHVVLAAHSRFTLVVDRWAGFHCKHTAHERRVLCKRVLMLWVALSVRGFIYCTDICDRIAHVVGTNATFAWFVNVLRRSFLKIECASNTDNLVWLFSRKCTQMLSNNRGLLVLLLHH